MRWLPTLTGQSSAAWTFLVQLGLLFWPCPQASHPMVPTAGGRVKGGGVERDHILGMQGLQLKEPKRKELENVLIYVYVMIF